jgi:YYY domain-containing protein
MSDPTFDSRRETGWRRFLDGRLALLAVILIAAALRLGGLHWDGAPRVEADGTVTMDDQHLHPDERFLTMVTSALELPESLGQYFDAATSPLNPHNRGYGFFVYGTFPIFLTRLVAIPFEMTEYWNVHLVGRVLAAAFSLVSVLLTYALGRRLYGPKVGMLGALLLAFAALPIQQAHFYTVDAFADAFVMMGLWFAVSIYESGRARSYAGFGVALGAAMACKLNLVLLAVIAVVAAVGGPLLRARREALGEASPAPPPSHGSFRLGDDAPLPPAPRRAPRRRWLLAPFAGLALAGLLSFLIFRLLQPYAFAGPGILGLKINPAWWANMTEIRELMSGARDIPPGHQWTDRLPIWFPWRNLTLWGLGTPLGLAAWAGWAMAGFELFRRRRFAHLVPWTWVLVLFGQQGTQWVKSLRYFLPIYPALTLFAALLTIEVGRRLRGEGDAGAGRLPVPAWRRRAAAALATIVIGGAATWAWAFTSIYRRPHSRIDASEWIYDNIPPGAVIAFEVWDDPLPLRTGGRDAGNIYRGIELHNYAEDDPAKLDRTLDSLSRTDVIVLSSNRLYDSIPRLPMRYPMMVRYYRHLFAGELGFRKAAEFTSYPRLFGIEFPDQKAEEAWSVYDHPRVQVFVRTPEWNAEKARALLTPPDWDDIDRLSPLEARRYHTLMMDPALGRAQRAGGTWLRGEPVAGARSGLFAPNGIANRHPITTFVVVLEILGLIAFPLCFAVFHRFGDRGWMMAKTVGLLLVGWAGWALASLRWLPWSGALLWALVAALGAVSAVLAWRERERLVAFVAGRWRTIALEELVFWAFFAFLVWCRWRNPDLWHAARGGEKPMDFTYLNAVVRSTFFPPYDPWFAGGYLNYYYFGFVLAAAPILLTGIVPAVAYNLVVPMFFALTAAGAFSGAAAMASALAGSRRRAVAVTLASAAPGDSLRRWLRWGIAGAVLVVAVGNLTEVSLIQKGLRELGGGPAAEEQASQPGGALGQMITGLREIGKAEVNWPLPNDWWFWNASRAIPHPNDEPPAITEFPFFTFLFADLHAHLMAQPITLLVLALAIQLALVALQRGGPAPTLATWSERGREALVLGLLSLATGSLWAINTWDYPLAILLASIGILLREGCTRGWSSGTSWGRALWRIAVVVVCGRLAMWWFHANFATLYTELGRWTGSRTAVSAYLAIHGLFLLLLMGWVTRELRLFRRARGALRLRAGSRWDTRPAWARRRQRLVSGTDYVAAALLAGGLLLALGLLIAGLRLEALLSVAMAMTAALALERLREPVHLLLCLLIGIGLGLSALVEHFVLSGDIGRMNTVFKFYLEIWLLWATASGAVMASLFAAAPVAARARRRSGGARVAVAAARWSFAAAVVLCAIAALLYPVFATPARLRDRFVEEPASSLDGAAFMTTATHHDQGPIELRWDADAIEWLCQNVVGTPVLLEASIPPYRWGSRVSMFTGLPTVIGWDWHQKQQRSVRRSDPVARRVRDVERIYSSASANDVVPLLRRYGVELIYVGQVERNYYPEEGLRKFAFSPDLFQPIYVNEQVEIYRVAGGSPPGAPPPLRPSAAFPRDAAPTG